LYSVAKGYERGEKGKNLPSNRAVTREHPLTSYFSARDIRLSYSYLTGSLQTLHEGDSPTSHHLPNNGTKQKDNYNNFIEKFSFNT